MYVYKGHKTQKGLIEKRVNLFIALSFFFLGDLVIFCLKEILWSCACVEWLRFEKKDYS